MSALLSVFSLTIFLNVEIILLLALLYMFRVQAD